LIDSLQQVEGAIPHDAKGAMMRINKDIRFSKDKTPYKTHVAAIISAHGKRNMRLPGMYVQISNDDVRFYSGTHTMEKDDLQNVRLHISENLAEFDKLLNDKRFKSVFGKVHGEQHKRLAPEFQEVAKAQPLMANKAFYYFKTYPSEFIFDDRIVQTLVNDYKAGYPLGQFLKEGILGA